MSYFLGAGTDHLHVCRHTPAHQGQHACVESAQACVGLASQVWWYHHHRALYLVWLLYFQLNGVLTAASNPLVCPHPAFKTKLWWTDTGRLSALSVYFFNILMNIAAQLHFLPLHLCQLSGRCSSFPLCDERQETPWLRLCFFSSELEHTCLGSWAVSASFSVKCICVLCPLCHRHRIPKRSLPWKKFPPWHICCFLQLSSAFLLCDLAITQNIFILANFI